jgi:hypothetical protein
MAARNSLYRKKPIIVEAHQFGSTHMNDWPDWLFEALERLRGVYGYRQETGLLRASKANYIPASRRSLTPHTSR